MSIERKIKILQFIPMQPPGVSIQQLKTKLAYRNIVCDTRTLQRDLIDLSAFMPLINDTQGRTHYWYWQPQASLMQFPSMDTQTALKLRVAPGLARILEERQLSADQTLSQDPDAAGWLLLTATVQETAQLRWWLLSQGDNLEVLAPPHVRQTFKQTLETMVQWYQQG